jgi:hypothetical protein
MNIKNLLLALLGCVFPSFASAQSQKSNAEVMQEMRLKMLTTPASEFGISPSPEHPYVYGVVMDWPINGQVASVVSLSDGNASLYSTSTFGVIGGFAHKRVADAARQFVKSSGRFLELAKPTSEYPLPSQDHVRFYLITFDGVKVIESDRLLVESNKDKLSELFGMGQNVLTELRQIKANEKRLTRRCTQQPFAGRLAARRRTLSHILLVQAVRQSSGACAPCGCE